VTHTDDVATQTKVKPVRNVLAVVLAAGGGSRFAGPGHKLLVSRDGRTVVEHAVEAAARALGDVLVVTGAVQLPASLTGLPGVRIVRNEDWAAGQATSLATAVAIADDDDSIDAIVVGLGDQPDISPEAWRRVAASTAPIAIATYEGRRRNPVRLHRSIWPLLPTAGDEGARALTRLRADLVEEVPCSGSPDDIDTLEDVLQWQSKSSTSSQ
jgi:CTP:molybdopterin cytidylyltransferase MocA